MGKTDYDERTDIWSLGCIISEIIKNLIQAKKSQPRERVILFNGDHSYMASPNIDEENEVVVDMQDQLIKVLEKVGD